MLARDRGHARVGACRSRRRRVQRGRDIKIEITRPTGRAGRSAPRILRAGGVAGALLLAALALAGTFELTGGHWGGGAAPTPPACPTDLNDSGATDFSDLVTVLSSWGTCVGCPADLDGNGAVEFSDLISILSAWGPCDGW